MKFQAKKSKEVLMYSTAHHDSKALRPGKPKIIDDYNKTKFAVDIFDEMTRRYAYSPSVRRWPVRLFMHLVDAAALNAYVLHNGNSTRREFIDELSDQLMEDQKNIHNQTDHFVVETFNEVAHLFDE